MKKKIFFGMRSDLLDICLSRLTQENIDVIQDNIQTRYEKLEKENLRAYKLISKTKNLASKSNFLKYYDEGVISDNGLDMIENIYEKDVNTFKKMNFWLFQDDIINLGEDIIYHIARYPELTQKLFIVKNNSPELYNEFVKEISSIKDTEHISTTYEEIKTLLTNFSKNTNIIQDVATINNESVVETGLRNSELFKDYLATNRGKTYSDFLDSRYKMLYKPRKEDKLKIFFEKYFSISSREAERLIKAYGEDIDSVKNNLEKENSSKILEQIKSVLETENLNAIGDLYANFDTKISAKDMIIFESDLRSAYAKTYTKAFEDTRNKINKLIQENSNNVKYIERDNKKIPIVKLTGSYNMLIHSSDTGFKGNKELNEESFRKTWEKNESPAQHLISTTINDEKFAGVAPIGPNGVYYAFLPDNPQSFNLMGNQDINSHVRSSNYSSEKSKYFSAKNMTSHARRVYSEGDIEKTQPDFLVVYDDMDNRNLENAYKAASEFNIPIIYIDKRELVKEQTDNINKLLLEFKENQSIDTLEKIIKTYETNKAGWLLNRVDSEETKMDSQINNNRFKENFDELGKEIGAVLKGYVKTAPREDLLKLKEILSNEEKLYEEQNKTNVPFSKVKMTDEFKLTLDDLKQLALDNMISFEEVSREERNLENIEKGKTKEKIQEEGQDYNE